MGGGLRVFVDAPVQVKTVTTMARALALLTTREGMRGHVSTFDIYPRHSYRAHRHFTSFVEYRDVTPPALASPVARKREADHSPRPACPVHRFHRTKTGLPRRRTISSVGSEKCNCQDWIFRRSVTIAASSIGIRSNTRVCAGIGRLT